MPSIGGPFDALEYGTQPLAPRRVHGLDETHATFQMGAEIRSSVTILTDRTVADAIVEGGFEPIVFVPSDVGVLVDDESSCRLPDSLAHNACFPAVHVEPLVAHDSANRGVEPADGSSQRLGAEARCHAAGSRVVMSAKAETKKRRRSLQPVSSGMSGCAQRRTPAHAMYWQRRFAPLGYPQRGETLPLSGSRAPA